MHFSIRLDDGLHQQQEGAFDSPFAPLAVPKMPTGFGRQNLALYTARLQLSRYALKAVPGALFSCGDADRCGTPQEG
ncbi:MAG: hypothetical protein JF629_04585 [Variovorax paradoxus]|nr:hypothetical protein [Variovorax paradoxus]MBW8715078.1 hypothetical protein [Variovorax paradoxus]